MGKEKNKHNEEDLEPLREGMLVEVSSNEEGFRGAYYKAKIIKLPPFSKNKRKGKALIQYQSLLTEDKISPLTESIDVSFIRPLPPFKPYQSFQPYDVVDAFYCDGWWKGVVSKVTVLNSENSYSVIFDDPPDQMELYSSDLRLHYDWINGEWVRPCKQKRMKGLKLSTGMAVEVNRGKEYSPDIWFPAAVLKEVGFNSFLVMYKDSSIINDNGLMRETVDSFHIRPPPPKFRIKRFDLLEKVDAFCDFGWRAGLIAKILTEERYIVQLQPGHEERKLNHSELRPRMHFFKGRWVSSSKDRSPSSHSVELTDATNNVENPVAAMQIGISDTAKALIEPNIPCVNFRMNLEQQSTSSNEISDGKRVRHREYNSEVALSCPSKRFKMDEPANFLSSSGCYKMPLAIMPEQALLIDGTVVGAQVPAESGSSFMGKNVENIRQEAALEGETVVSTIESERLPNALVQSQQLSKADVNTLEDATKQVSVEDNVEVEHTAKETDLTASAAERARGKSPNTSCELPDEEINMQNDEDKNQQQKGKEHNAVGDSIIEMDFEGWATKEVELPGVTGAGPAGWEDTPNKDSIEDIVEAEHAAKEKNSAILAEETRGTSPRTSCQHPEVEKGDIIRQQKVKEVELPGITGVESAGASGEMKGLVSPTNYMAKEVDEAMAKTSCYSSSDDQPLSLCSKGRNPGSPSDKLHDASGTQLETVMQSPVVNVPVNNQLADASMAETFCRSFSDGQQLSLCTEGHNPSSPVNKLNDDSERQLETTALSPVVNVHANSPLVEYPETPFMKSSPIWEDVESLEIFRYMPQKPHFRPLVKCKELFREGFAVGNMVNFATVVDKTFKLHVGDPADVIYSYLDTLAELETFGFDVKAIVNRLNKFLSIKDKVIQLQDQSKENETQLTKCNGEKYNLEEDIEAIDEQIRMLKKKQALDMSVKKTIDSKLASLDLNVINEDISKSEQEFKNLAAASW